MTAAPARRACAPTDVELPARLQTVIARLLKTFTRGGVLVEDMGQTWLAKPDADGAEAHAAAAAGRGGHVSHRLRPPHAGRKVLTLTGAMPRHGAVHQPSCAGN